MDWFKKGVASSQNKITGSYKFHLRSEPEYVDTASTINVTAFSDKTESVGLPCTYKWSRIRNGLTE